MNYGSRTILRLDGLGTPIAAYPDIKAAAEDTHLSTRDLRVAIQQRGMMKGCFFRYVGTEPWEAHNPRLPYEQYDPKTGELLNRFTSLRQAAQALGVSYDKLRFALNNNRRDPFGKKWRKV